MVNRPNLSNLLQGTKRILAHHEELSIAKGEHFNLFSVLKIENRENNTHSAFLAEMLDPNGSHLQGTVFLNLFLQLLNTELKELKPELNLLAIFNSKETKVTTEFHIGNIDVEEKIGGRIDILLTNSKNILSIENKIHAPDQPAQVQRYCNYQEKNNTVFYLTLEGGDPHEDSCGKLISGIHFFNLSYREHIINWLELCLKEVPNLTSVREAINQYILLIKKLTKTLNMEQEKEIEEIMLEYIKEASFVASKYEDMVVKFKKSFREDIKSGLKCELNTTEYRVTEGKNVSYAYSQLWIEFVKDPNSKYKYGIASFSGEGHDNGNMFVGLLGELKSQYLLELPESNRLNDAWRHTKSIMIDNDGDPKHINLKDFETLRVIADSEETTYKNLVRHIVNETVEFINLYEAKIAALRAEDQSIHSVESLK